jgi:hypothetical protein
MTPLLPDEVLEGWQTNLRQKSPMPRSATPMTGELLLVLLKKPWLNRCPGMRSDQSPPLLKVKGSSDLTLMQKAMCAGPSGQI